MSKNTISNANELFFGPWYKPGSSIDTAGQTRDGKGIQLRPMIKFDLGDPIAADADALIDAATGAEVPNASTVTYTFDGTTTTGGSSPQDGANQSGVLDIARNVTCTISATGAAWSAAITGTDINGDTLAKTVSVAANETSGATSAAFKTVTQVALTSTGNLTSNTVDVGFGDVFGLPVVLENKSDLITFFNGAVDASATIVTGVTTTGTASSGDTRGTVDPNSAANGSELAVWLLPTTSPSKESLHGVANYTG